MDSVDSRDVRLYMTQVDLQTDVGERQYKHQLQMQKQAVEDTTREIKEKTRALRVSNRPFHFGYLGTAGFLFSLGHPHFNGFWVSGPIVLAGIIVLVWLYRTITTL